MVNKIIKFFTSHRNLSSSLSSLLSSSLSLFVIVMVIVIVIVLIAATAVNAWTNPTTAPGIGGGSLYYYNANIGIGTATPGQKLTVVGTIESTSGGFKFPDTTTQTTAYAGGSQTISAANVSANVFGANTGFGNYTFGTSTNPILHIDNTNSRVGIGTTGPLHKFDVRGDSVFYGTETDYMEGMSVFYPGGATTGGGVNLHIGAAGTPIGSGTMKSYYRVRGTSFNTVIGIFGGAVGEITPIEIVNANGNVLLAQSTGNVGIGTTGPITTIDVRGGMTVGGDITNSAMRHFINWTQGTPPGSAGATGQTISDNAIAVSTSQFGWHSSPSSCSPTTPDYGGIDLGAGNAKTVKRVRFQVHGNPFANFVLQGSNDSTTGLDGTWADLLSSTLTERTEYAWQSFDVSNSTAYRWYRAKITSMYATGWAMYKWELLETATAVGNNYISGALGVGTNVPKSMLDVNGAVSIGANYGGIYRAPLNGMIIEGNVGIGTTGPVKKLTIHETTDNDYAIYIRQPDQGAANTAGWYFGVDNLGSLTMAYDNNVGKNENLVITTNGNVGIGTTGPGAKLHVSSGDTSLALFGPNTTWGGKLYVGASPNQAVAATAQVIATDGNLHLDPAPAKNLYLGYYQPANIMINGGTYYLNAGTSYLNALTLAGNLTVSGSASNTCTRVSYTVGGTVSCPQYYYTNTIGNPTQSGSIICCKVDNPT